MCEFKKNHEKAILSSNFKLLFAKILAIIIIYMYIRIIVDFLSIPSLFLYCFFTFVRLE